MMMDYLSHGGDDGLFAMVFRHLNEVLLGHGGGKLC